MPENLSPRGYQLEVFNEAINDNIIAFLPTGAGKTLIAILVLKHFHEQSINNGSAAKKLIGFLAPTNVLLAQQKGVVKELCPSLRFTLFSTDNISLSEKLYSKEHWARRLHNVDIVFFTPEVLRIIFEKAILLPSAFSLLIIDECHHVSTNSSLGVVCEQIKAAAKAGQSMPVDNGGPTYVSPRLLGLTASPVSRKDCDVADSLKDIQEKLGCRLMLPADTMDELFDAVPEPEYLLLRYKKKAFAFLPGDGVGDSIVSFISTCKNMSTIFRNKRQIRCTEAQIALDTSSVFMHSYLRLRLVDFAVQLSDGAEIGCQWRFDEASMSIKTIGPYRATMQVLKQWISEKAVDFSGGYTSNRQIPVYDPLLAALLSTASEALGQIIVLIDNLGLLCGVDAFISFLRNIETINSISKSNENDQKDSEEFGEFQKESSKQKSGAGGSKVDSHLLMRQADEIASGPFVVDDLFSPCNSQLNSFFEFWVALASCFTVKHCAKASVLFRIILERKGILVAGMYQLGDRNAVDLKRNIYIGDMISELLSANEKWTVLLMSKKKYFSNSVIYLLILDILDTLGNVHRQNLCEDQVSFACRLSLVFGETVNFEKYFTEYDEGLRERGKDSMPMQQNTPSFMNDFQRGYGAKGISLLKHLCVALRMACECLADVVSGSDYCDIMYNNNNCCNLPDGKQFYTESFGDAIEKLNGGTVDRQDSDVGLQRDTVTGSCTSRECLPSFYDYSYLYNESNVPLQSSSPLKRYGEQRMSNDGTYTSVCDPSIGHQQSDCQKLSGYLSSKTKAALVSISGRCWSHANAEPLESSRGLFSGIVFCKSRLSAICLQKICQRLVSSHFDSCDDVVNSQMLSLKSIQSGVIVGGTVAQSKQFSTLKDFKRGNCNILFATAVAEEGLDILSCQLVVNFDAPENVKSFIQRRGRARAQNSIFIMLSDLGESGVQVIRDIHSYRLQEVEIYKRAHSLLLKSKEKKTLDLQDGDSQSPETVDNESPAGPLIIFKELVRSKGTYVESNGGMCTYRVHNSSSSADLRSASALINRVSLAYSIHCDCRIDELRQLSPPETVAPSLVTPSSFQCSMSLTGCFPVISDGKIINAVDNVDLTSFSVVSSSGRTKKLVKSKASLELIIILHENGYLDDTLFPFRRERVVLTKSKRSGQVSGNCTKFSDEMEDAVIKVVPDCFAGPDFFDSNPGASPVSEPISLKCFFYKFVCQLDEKSAIFPEDEEILQTNQLYIQYLAALHSFGFAIYNEIPDEVMDSTFQIYICSIPLAVQVKLVAVKHVSVLDIDEMQRFHRSVLCMENKTCVDEARKTPTMSKLFEEWGHQSSGNSYVSYPYCDRVQAALVDYAAETSTFRELVANAAEESERLVHNLNCIRSIEQNIDKLKVGISDEPELFVGKVMCRKVKFSGYDKDQIYLGFPEKDGIATHFDSLLSYPSVRIPEGVDTVAERTALIPPELLSATSAKKADKPNAKKQTFAEYFRGNDPELFKTEGDYYGNINTTLIPTRLWSGVYSCIPLLGRQSTDGTIMTDAKSNYFVVPGSVKNTIDTSLVDFNKKRPPITHYLIPRQCYELGLSKWFLVSMLSPSLMFRLESLLLVDECKGTFNNLVIQQLSEVNEKLSVAECNVEDRDGKLTSNDISPAQLQLPSVGNTVDVIAALPFSSSNNGTQSDFLSTPIDRLPSIPSIMHALTPSMALEDFNSERLEMLGDTILKFIMSRELFFDFPYANEEELSSRRSFLVSNYNLYEAAKRFKILPYLRAFKFSHGTQKLNYIFPGVTASSSVFFRRALPPQITDGSDIEERSLRNRHILSSKEGRDKEASKNYLIFNTVTDVLCGIIDTLHGPDAERHTKDTDTVIESDPDSAVKIANVSHVKVLYDCIEVKKKFISDIIESMVAVFYQHGGLSCATTLLKSLHIWPENDNRSKSEASISNDQRKSKLQFCSMFNISEGDRIDGIEKCLGYRFRNFSLLAEALTHKSCVGFGLPSNQRLEYFGDAVLDFGVIELLYSHEKLIHADEGELSVRKTLLVENKNLARLCVSLKLYSYMFVTKDTMLYDCCKELAEESNNVAATSMVLQHPFLLKAFADVFESLMGALFLDCEESMEVAKNVINRTVLADYDTAAPLPHIVRKHLSNLSSEEQKSVDITASSVIDEEVRKLELEFDDLCLEDVIGMQDTGELLSGEEIGGGMDPPLTFLCTDDVEKSIKKREVLRERKEKSILKDVFTALTCVDSGSVYPPESISDMFAKQQMNGNMVRRQSTNNQRNIGMFQGTVNQFNSNIPVENSVVDSANNMFVNQWKKNDATGITDGGSLDGLYNANSDRKFTASRYERFFQSMHDT